MTQIVPKYISEMIFIVKFQKYIQFLNLIYITNFSDTYFWPEVVIFKADDI